MIQFMFKTLHLEKITETLDVLHARIGERFADCGLLKVCVELNQLARASRDRIAWITRPNKTIRLGISLVIAVGIIACLFGLHWLKLQPSVPSFGEFVQLTEAFLNTLVLVGASLFFLFTLETRIKRMRTLKALHELRSIAHVIDMHQLTKDPVISYSVGEQPTPSSPKRLLNAFELRRYLDYCAELLSIVGKTAALYSQKMPDETIVAAANDVETLCASMGHKIWQKIMIIHADLQRQPHDPL
jgi:hypothetical protein